MVSLNDYKSANSDKDRMLKWLALNKKKCFGSMWFYTF